MLRSEPDELGERAGLQLLSSSPVTLDLDAFVLPVDNQARIKLLPCPPPDPIPFWTQIAFQLPELGRMDGDLSINLSGRHD